MVKLVSLTQPSVDGIRNAEELIVYCARVSNPENQSNTETAPKLIKYLIDHKHWSPFEMVDLCVEIKTSRAISAQLLRHKSFGFQEFSTRYSSATSITDVELRAQSAKNRQSSKEIISDVDCENMVNNHLSRSLELYSILLQRNVARECARMVLPLATETTLYMKGSVRSWIHYLELRTKEDTQKEHREIAEEILELFKEVFPNISEALEW